MRLGHGEPSIPNLGKGLGVALQGVPAKRPYKPYLYPEQPAFLGFLMMIFLCKPLKKVG